MGKLEASKKPARGQQRPARSQQQASKTPARTSNRPGRGPKWGGPHETPKPLKNSHFHEENSPFSRAFPKTDFLEKFSWGSLKPARGQQEARKKPARGQQEASKKPAASQQDASKTPARGQQEARKKPTRGQQEASKRPGRGPKWGGPHETPKPLKNSHFHEENSPFSRAFPKTDFLEKFSWGSLKPARSQQEARKRPARGQQEASKRQARSQQQASKTPARRQQEASKRPGRGQQEGSKRPGEAPNGGDPRNTETIEKTMIFMKRIHRFREPSQKPIF